MNSIESTIRMKIKKKGTKKDVNKFEIRNVEKRRIIVIPYHEQKAKECECMNVLGSM